MEQSFFTGLQWSDAAFLGEALLRTVWISILSISTGSVLGIFFGWLLYEGRLWAAPLSLILDAFRSIPLIIQLVLFFNLFAIMGFPMDPFTAGTIVLAFYTSALVANVARGGIEAVGRDIRRAGRSLGMSYRHDMLHVVWPIGLRAVLPAWIGVALGVVKDSALVSVLGYVELLKASQILMTRTQEPFIILAIVGGLYFLISFPVGRIGMYLERKWAS